MKRLLTGQREELVEGLRRRYPELGTIRLRRGGLPPRLAGWLLGQPTVAAVTLWSTVWLGARTPQDEELLLHESRHVQHFRQSWLFPLRYIWASLRHGYHHNPYEIDARAFAAQRVADQRMNVLMSPALDDRR